ncbi:MAG: DUF362 domain-containing protein [Clostridia bacterium]|nr:DUF362 domain-containing protein [Clostridia bacterium]
MYNPNSPVAVAGCDEYAAEKVSAAINEIMPKIGAVREAIEGKKVLIKPNLLLAYAPGKAATTHPAVVEAVCEYLKKLSPASLIIAESPGGPYNQATFTHICHITGMKKVSENTGVPLCEDFEAEEISIPDGVNAKSLKIIKPALEADVIVNVCKAKTHSLATMTAAGKNLFGLVPGITKFEMHARFKDQHAFLGMICDLDCAIAARAKVFSVCDAVVGMEGNGPSGGTPKPFGAIIGSENPFCLDIALAKALHLDPVPLNETALERGLAAENPVIDGDMPDVPFAPADATLSKKFSNIPKFLEPKPFIDSKVCRGCFVCVNSCPQHTIEKKNGVAKINGKNCIKCYCCQELCTFRAVKIKKNFIYKLIK